MKKAIGLLCLGFLLIFFTFVAHEFLRNAQANQENSDDIFPTPVDSQITDFVTQTNTEVLGEAPAMAMGNIYQTGNNVIQNASATSTNTQQLSGTINSAEDESEQILQSIDSMNK